MNYRAALSRVWPSILVAFVILTTGLFFYRATAVRDDIRFLSAQAPGQWILYRSPLSLGIFRSNSLAATFRHSLTLHETPKKAALTLRAFKTCASLQVNGKQVPLTSTMHHWKEAVCIDITTFLHPGDNTLLATVANDCGPPALWLALTVDQQPVLCSDETWEASLMGATWLPVALASDPVPLGNADPGGTAPDSLTAVSRVWIGWLIIMLLAIAVLLLARHTHWQRYLPATWNSLLTNPQRTWNIAAVLVYCIISMVWLAVIVHDTKYLPPQIGFDAHGHLDYIDRFMKSSSVPLPGDGWQTHHPPLYHFLAATLLKCFHQSPTSDSGIAILRFFNGLISIGILGIVLLSLRLVFPQHPRRWILGLILIGFLPMTAYYQQYPANHLLGALWTSLSLYLTLRILIRPAKLRDYAYLGVAFGLAMLSVVSSVVLALPIGAALVAKAYLNRSSISLSRAFSQLLIVTLLAGMVCGWYYARVWQRFGTPFVANIGAKQGSPLPWWQQPGYRAEHDYLRFGLGLWSPMFSARYSVWDGFYSTLWGDSFGGGTTTIEACPPWSYDHIAAGMLLAIVPTLVAIGTVASVLIKWLKHPTLVWGFLLGAIYFVVVMMVYTTLLAPYYSTPKAFYGLAILVPIGLFLALGFDKIAEFNQWSKTVLYVFLALFCGDVLCAYWIPANSPPAREWLAGQLARQGRVADAVHMLESTVAEYPESTRTRVKLAQFHLQQNTPERAAAVLQHIPNVYDLPARHYLMAMLHADDQNSRAMFLDELRVAAEAAPDDPTIAKAYAAATISPTDIAGAIAIYQNLLRIDPCSANLHSDLANLYRQTGDLKAAEQHEQWAHQLQNAQPK